MANAFYQIQKPENEPVLSYAPGSPERAELKAALKKLKSKYLEFPMIINGKKVKTGETIEFSAPHDHSLKLGFYHKGSAEHVTMAIDAALAAKKDWETMPWQERAAIFLKAADLLTGPYRAKMNAAVMLGQSKNVFQAEIDAIAELADFFRFNAYYMTQIYKDQPYSPNGVWNRMEYRPLEGFIFALTPFNFTSIAGNLPGAPALLGNTVVWKPARTQIYSAALIMEIFEKAGLPAGVINIIYVDGPAAGEVIFKHKDFAGLHFTGSLWTLQNLWHTISKNLPNYKAFPRIVGETGGKDFVMVHKSADPKHVATALVRGAFEYQGQKCSAASRAYIPKSLWKRIKKYMAQDIDTIKIGSPEDFSVFYNAVIDEKSFDKISGYIAQAKKDKEVDIVIGGGYDKSKGLIIEPTVMVTTDPKYVTMQEEIFGPVLTVFVYEDKHYLKTLRLLDETSPYGLTGAVFATDRKAIMLAIDELRHAAGNFYINDKPTGAVVGQQPFGGARASGTNDKAGSILNLYRWISPRSIKETFVPPNDYRYPFMKEEK